MRRLNRMLQVFVLGVMASFISVGCTVMQGEENLQEYSQDATITAKIKKRLVQNDQVSATKIHVETDKGVVLLSGFVHNETQSKAAVDTALGVEGVKAVKNNLVLREEAHSQTMGAKAKRSMTYETKKDRSDMRDR